LINKLKILEDKHLISMKKKNRIGCYVYKPYIVNLVKKMEWI